MSAKRGYSLNGKSLYTNVAMPQETWVQFTVASTNANGWGVTSVKSNGFVNSVFMHTTQTAGVQNGQTNPNPQAGFAIITFTNPFNYWLGGMSMLNPPLTSTGTTSLTAGDVYVITSLGTTTTAQWETAGLPAGLAPTVGQAFVAKSTASLSGTGTVGIPGVPTTAGIVPVGTPNTTITNSNIAANGGAQLTLQFCAPTSSSVTTLVAAAPADGTVVSLQLCYDASTVTVDGL